jgi:hypothetical protein
VDASGNGYEVGIGFNLSIEVRRRRMKLLNGNNTFLKLSPSLPCK